MNTNRHECMCLKKHPFDFDLRLAKIKQYSNLKLARPQGVQDLSDMGGS